ncbi:MAG TPA: hypothetical protein VF331_05125, partial [Polyangiales bacterium]
MLAAASRLLGVRTSEISFVTLSGVLVMLAMAVNVLALGTVTALFLGATTRGQLPTVYALGAAFGALASAL